MEIVTDKFNKNISIKNFINFLILFMISPIILFLYFLSGIIGKILTISFVILVLAIPYILFFGDEE